jgi:hypothetical protein
VARSSMNFRALRRSKILVSGLIVLVGFIGTVFAINPQLNPFLEKAKPETGLSVDITDLEIDESKATLQIRVVNEGRYPVKIISMSNGLIEAPDDSELLARYESSISRPHTQRINRIIRPWDSGTLLFSFSRHKVTVRASSNRSETLAYSAIVFEDGSRKNRFRWNRFVCVRYSGNEVDSQCRVGRLVNGMTRIGGPAE